MCRIDYEIGSRTLGLQESEIDQNKNGLLFDRTGHA
jgi:hypothetical protein